MVTNISIPEKLKQQAEILISRGYYSSFSDLVRTSLRDTLNKSTYDLLLEEAKENDKQEKTTRLESKKDIQDFIKKSTYATSGRNKKV